MSGYGLLFLSWLIVLLLRFFLFVLMCLTLGCSLVFDLFTVFVVIAYRAVWRIWLVICVRFCWLLFCGVGIVV